MPDENANVIAGIVARCIDTKMKIAVAEAELDEMEQTLRTLSEAADIDTAPLGMRRIIGKGSVSDRIVPVLKERGLRAAVQTKETVNSKRLNEYIEAGEISEEEVDGFRGKSRDYYKYSIDKGE
jgi:hypothetical protein